MSAVVLTASMLVSCKPNNSTTEKEEKQETKAPKQAHHHESHGHHHSEGERKGPHPGGGHGPEQTKTLEEIGGYKIGEVATDFELKNVDGSMFSLTNIENAKGYIVTFTCNDCPFAKMYEDRLIEIHNEYAPKGYSVVAINPNSAEGYAAMQQRAEEKGFPFVYLIDEKQEIYPQYGAVRTPHVFLLDNERKVQYIGSIDDNARSAKDVKVTYLANAIEALENGEKPEPNLTKAIGCPIKANKG